MNYPITECMPNEWIKPKDAPTGRVLLAWCDGALLPSYKLVSKNEKGKWVIEATGTRTPKNFFSYVMELPTPKS
jgi:hypothetical protein